MSRRGSREAVVGGFGEGISRRRSGGSDVVFVGDIRHIC